jgi:hypothetical protein
MNGRHVKIGASSTKNHKFQQQKGNKKGKGTGKGKGMHGKGKGGKKDLDFLDADDGGHFGLLQHIAPSDLSHRKWVKVEMGDVIPEGFDASQFVCLNDSDALA